MKKSLLFLLFISLIVVNAKLNASTPIVTSNDFVNETWWMPKPEYLVDNNNSTSWASRLDGRPTTWILFEYPVAELFNNYTIVSSGEADPDGSKRDMRNWKLYGSNNNVDFTLLDTRTDQPSFESRLQGKNFTFQNTTAYKYYKLDVLSRQVGTWVCELVEFNLSFFIDNQKPTTPTLLSSEAVLHNTATINWAASSDNIEVSKYEIYNNGLFIASVPGTQLKCVLASLTPSTNYLITVKACDPTNNKSDASAEYAFVTKPLPALVDLFVSAANNSGVENGSLSNPFKTISQAVAIAEYGTTINIRSGEYREQVSLKSDGITYKGYNNERPVINGCDVLTNWTIENGTTYKTTMNWDVTMPEKANQLFCDKKMLQLVRWPNQTSNDLIHPTDGVVSAVSRLGNNITITCANFDEPDGRWVGAEIWVNLAVNGHDGHGWTGEIVATNLANKTITFNYRNTPETTGPWTVEANTEFYLFNPTEVGILSSGGINSVLSPGEWWKNGSTVYVKLPNENKPAEPTELTNIVEAKKRLFAFVGSHPIKNFSEYTIKNVDLFASTIVTDVLFDIRDNVVVEDARNIMIDNVHAKYLTHINELRGNYQNQLSGRSGIVVSGSNNTIKNCHIQYSAGPGICLIGERNKMFNNTVLDCNYSCSNSGAVNLGSICNDSQIGHNLIDNTPVMAIHFKGLKNTNPKHKFVSRIHHNKVIDACERTWDSGAIDMVGQDGFWIRIDHNEIFNRKPATQAESARNAIYLDFGSTASSTYYPGRYLIDHNLIYNVGVPILINHIMDVLVYNNTGVNVGDARIAIVNGNGGTGKRDTIYNNIFGGTWNNNSWGSLSNAVKRTNIFDAKGIRMNELFTDAANYDFTLKANAFTAIDIATPTPYNDSVIGVTADLGCFEFGVEKWVAGLTELLPPTLYPNGGSYLNSVKVAAKSEIEGAVLRYTTNGSDPTYSSPIFPADLELTDDTTFIKVRAFLPTGAKSEVNKANFIVSKPVSVPLVSNVTPSETLLSGLNSEYYQNLVLQKIPDMDTYEPTSTIVLPNFGVNQRPATEDNFLLRFTGYINVPKDGLYTFYVISDDGSKLYLHNTLLIDNDNVQAPTEKSGQIGLKAGYHPIKLEFLEYSGAQTLQLYMRTPGGVRQLVLDEELFHTPYIPYTAKPTITPSSSTFSNSMNFTIATKSADAAIYYTLNGDNPTINSLLYSAPVTITSSTSVKAMAVKTGLSESMIATATFEINTGVKSLKNNSFVLYPNPTNGLFHLKMFDNFVSEKCFMRIDNLSGATVYNQVITSKEFSPLVSLAPGMYIVTVTQNDKIEQTKLIIH